MKSLILIVHNIRSSHNVGSILRTADGLGVERVFLTGYTPYPHSQKDTRLPHISRKVDAQIHKTALGAEKSVSWEHQTDIKTVIAKLRQDKYQIVALEQTAESTSMVKFKPQQKLALIVGREVEGLEDEVIEMCDLAVEITMSGQKESFNVAIAAAIFLSYCQYS
ncbi:MAG TPA: TrmH family RNA methyltransferase [Candidatus Saccharimonadales bacterium]|nr:TrmH family RNA methyltransferase [Candidatus Saccharimonadales bacterium]